MSASRALHAHQRVPFVRRLVRAPATTRRRRRRRRCRCVCNNIIVVSAHRRSPVNGVRLENLFVLACTDTRINALRCNIANR